MEKLVYTDAIEYELPESLLELSGPAFGVVELPRAIYWGPEATVDLADPVDLQRMYQAVVRSASARDQAKWLNKNL